MNFYSIALLPICYGLNVMDPKIQSTLTLSVT